MLNRFRYRLPFMSRGIARKIGSFLIVVVILSMSGVGLWSLVGPEHNARVWLDKISVRRGESLRLNIRNLGAGWIEPDLGYQLFREYENGTVEDMIEWEWGRIAPMRILRLFGTYSQKIHTRLEPGEYYVIIGYTVNGAGNYSKKLYFTVE